MGRFHTSDRLHSANGGGLSPTDLFARPRSPGSRHHTTPSLTPDLPPESDHEATSRPGTTASPRRIDHGPEQSNQKETEGSSKTLEGQSICPFRAISTGARLADPHGKYTSYVR